MIAKKRMIYKERKGPLNIILNNIQKNNNDFS